MNMVEDIIKKSPFLVDYPFIAVNAEAQGCALERIDKEFYGAPSTEPLTAADQLSVLMDLESAIQHCEAVCDDDKQEQGNGLSFTLYDGSQFIVTEDQLQDLWERKENRPGM
jgi:hypothetical protein